jgi:hypothetical protein
MAVRRADTSAGARSSARCTRTARPGRPPPRRTQRSRRRPGGSSPQAHVAWRHRRPSGGQADPPWRMSGDGAAVPVGGLPPPADRPSPSQRGCARGSRQPAPGLVRPARRPDRSGSRCESGAGGRSMIAQIR